MRADRLLALLLLLQTNTRMTARELAERLDVSERTIYRDLDALSAVGIPVYAERGPGGGCRLLDGYQTHLNGLTPDEIRALFLASAQHAAIDLGYDRALDTAQLKLTTALPEKHRSIAAGTRQRIHIDTHPWKSSPQTATHLQAIQEAVWHDRRIRLTYCNTTGSFVEHAVDPYGLVTKAGCWYLVGAVEGAVRVYRLTRIEAVAQIGDVFERPGDFDLIAFWNEWCNRRGSTRIMYHEQLPASTQPHDYTRHVTSSVRSSQKKHFQTAFQKKASQKKEFPRLLQKKTGFSPLQKTDWAA